MYLVGVVLVVACKWSVNCSIAVSASETHGDGSSSSARIQWR